MTQRSIVSCVDDIGNDEDDNALFYTYVLYFTFNITKSDEERTRKRTGESSTLVNMNTENTDIPRIDSAPS